MQRLYVIITALAGLVAAATFAHRDRAGNVPAAFVGDTCRAGGTAMVRNELYFGLSRKDAAAVSEAEWAAFVDAEVTPRFPDGLTVVDSYGQWRNAAGVIAKERSKVLIIWHPPSAGADASLEAIRTAYKARFAQESVMRVDAASCVSF